MILRSPTLFRKMLKTYVNTTKKTIVSGAAYEEGSPSAVNDRRIFKLANGKGLAVRRWDGVPRPGGPVPEGTLTIWVVCGASLYPPACSRMALMEKPVPDDEDCRSFDLLSDDREEPIDQLELEPSETFQGRKRQISSYCWDYSVEHDPIRDPSSQAGKRKCIKCLKWFSQSTVLQQLVDIVG